MQSTQKSIPWKERQKMLAKGFVRYRYIFLMLLPVFLYFLIFSYYTMGLGVLNSFFNIRLLGNSIFVGFQNYKDVLASPLYAKSFINTLVVGIGTMVLQFVWGLLLAICINELRNKLSRSFFQTIAYIPNLLSWAVVGSIWINLLSPTGLINGLLSIFPNYKPIVFMAERGMAREIMIFTGAWKTAGYIAALYLAAIVSIDPLLFEAASIDGASRAKQILYITIPQLKRTSKVIIMLGTMGLLRNFDQIFIMSNASTLDTIRNLLYLIYTQGILEFKIGPASAAATLVLVATLIISFAVRKIIAYDNLE